MATSSYMPVFQPNTTFGQPRQRTWLVWRNNKGTGVGGWTIIDSLHSYKDALDLARVLVNYPQGALYYTSEGNRITGFGNTSINDVIVCEVVPIDDIMTPQV